MRWPWVSRTAFEAVSAERDYLRQQLENERDHNQRIERVQAGLGELTPKQRKPPPAMPKEVAKLIEQYDDVNIRRDIVQRAWNVVRSGQQTWEDVETRLREALEVA